MSSFGVILKNIYHCFKSPAINLCKTEVSSYTWIKTACHKRLNVEVGLRIELIVFYSRFYSDLWNSCTLFLFCFSTSYLKVYYYVNIQKVFSKFYFIVIHLTWDFALFESIFKYFTISLFDAMNLAVSDTSNKWNHVLFLLCKWLILLSKM